MSFTTYLNKKVLDHVLKTAAYTQPTNIYVGVHIATTLASAGTATDTTISVTHAMALHAKLVVDPGGASEETFYVGAISGSGPYTVTLEDINGDADALANSHSSGVKVKFDPSGSASTKLEPGAGSYARTLHNAWNAAADLSDELNSSEATNDGSVALAQATGAAWGLATHVLLFDASSGGNVLARGELSTALDIVEDSTVTFPDETLKVRLQEPARS